MSNLILNIKIILVNIKNLIKWFPVIWEDRQWDEHFMWKLFAKKLEFMYKYLTEKSHIDLSIPDQKEAIDAINELKDICINFSNTQYETDAFAEYDKKWYDPNWIDKIVKKEDNNGNIIYSAPELEEEQRKDLDKANKLADANYKKLMERFCEIMTKYAPSWWD